MKNVILASVLLAAVVSFGVKAWTGNSENNQEIILKTLTDQEMSNLEASFQQFSSIERMELVAVKENQFLKITGLGLNNSPLTQMAKAIPECGDCEYEDGENYVPGIWRSYYQPGHGTIVYCGTCEFDSNPGPQ